jgi:hypothetical protein
VPHPNDVRGQVDAVANEFADHSRISEHWRHRTGLSMSATGQPDGDYILGSLPVKVVDGRARLLAADGSLGAIAGSTLTMGRAVEFVTSVVGIPPPAVAVRQPHPGE